MKSSSGESGGSWSRVFDLLAHRRIKYKDEFTEASALGAGLSLIGVVVMLTLLLLETVSWLTVRPTVGTALASAHGHNVALSIKLNISFPTVPCSLLSLAAYDATGLSSANVSSHGSSVHFYKLDGSSGALMRRVREGLGGAAPEYEALEGAWGAGNDGAAIYSGGGGEEAKPTRLHIGNFHEFIAANKLAFVTFGAPWCPWCRRLAPEWDATAAIVTARAVPGVALGTVDCTEPDAQELCKSQHIAAFPTILLYTEGIDHSHVNYGGHRTREALLAFLVRAVQLGPTLVTAPKEAHEKLIGHTEDEGEANEHAAALSKLHSLMELPPDDESDPAEPAGAQALIEAMHAAGLAAPGDAKRKAAAVPVANIAAALAAVGNAVDAPARAGEGGGGGGQPEGCSVAGSLSVKRVPGRLVFRVGGEGMSVINAAVNLSHSIHTLYFGEQRLSAYQVKRLGGSYGADVQRLAGTAHVSREPHTAWSYYLSIVPHVFSFGTGHGLHSYAYTAESHAFVLPEGDADAGLPGGLSAVAPSVTFAYEISPLAVTVTEERRPMWAWAVSIAAIVGGVVAALSLLDSILHGVAGMLARGTKKAT